MTDIDLNTLPKTRKEAIEQGSKYYFTGKPCKHGHVSKRISSNRACFVCGYEQSVNYRKENLEKVRAIEAKSKKKDYLKNRNERIKKSKMWREANKEKQSAMKTLYYELNRDIVLKRAKHAYKFNKNGRRDNIIARNAKRKCSHGSGALPKEIRGLLLKQNYKCASCLSSVKKKRHLDHIIPLSKGGDSSIGNLQWLCPKCNLRKSAKDPYEWAQENGRLL